MDSGDVICQFTALLRLFCQQQNWGNHQHQWIFTDEQLVGGIPTPLKNMKFKWEYYSQYMESHKHVPNHQPEEHWRMGPNSRIGLKEKIQEPCKLYGQTRSFSVDFPPERGWCGGERAQQEPHVLTGSFSMSYKVLIGDNQMLTWILQWEQQS